MQYPSIVKFLQTQYTDERLAMLLAHAEDGKLSYHSCCCFIGITTADHALEGIGHGSLNLDSHLARARRLPDSSEAEEEFYRMGKPDRFLTQTEPTSEAIRADIRRREAIIPLIKAEMARRAQIALPLEESKQVEELVAAQR